MPHFSKSRSLAVISLKREHWKQRERHSTGIFHIKKRKAHLKKELKLKSIRAESPAAKKCRPGSHSNGEAMVRIAECFWASAVHHNNRHEHNQINNADALLFNKNIQQWNWEIQNAILVFLILFLLSYWKGKTAFGSIIKFITEMDYAAVQFSIVQIISGSSICWVKTH